MNKYRMFLWTLLLVLVLAACAGRPASSPTEGENSTGADTGGDAPSEGAAEREYRIVTLLPRDAIPAIDNPEFLTASEADSEYSPDEHVIGVSFNGQSRAYSISLLSGHEIVNDEVGGVKFAVTW